MISIIKSIVYRFPKLALAYQAMRDSSRLENEPQETPLGFKFSGNKQMVEGRFEVLETEIVREQLKNSDILINIGANIGYYCCIALDKGIPVVAFEPVDSNLKFLYANMKANAWDAGIEIFPIALSNNKGLLEIYGGGTGASLVEGGAGTSSNYKRLVPVNTLDNVLGDRFDGKSVFILVDIEGAEKEMLDGASYLLNMEPKPIWMIEITVSTHQPKGVDINPHLLSTFQIFWNAGYKAYTADSNRRLVTFEEVSNIQNGGENTLQVHNFLFSA